MERKLYMALLVSALTLGMSANAVGDENALSSYSNLDVYISLSMPKESLLSWQNEAKRYQARLVMRGFVKDSLQKTVKALRFIDGNALNVNIDPPAFRRHHITQVPAVVLSDGGKNDIVYGNTSLTAALETIAREGELHEVAKRLLRIAKEEHHA